MADENPDSASPIFFQTYLLDSEVDIVRRIAIARENRFIKIYREIRDIFKSRLCKIFSQYDIFTGVSKYVLY